MCVLGWFGLPKIRHVALSVSAALRFAGCRAAGFGAAQLGFPWADGGGGEPFACLTCYDATTARWLARVARGVPVLLVGDTAAEVVLGLPRTIDMPLDVLIALTAGVKRVPGCVVMADMPFMSYQTDDATAIRNAGRFLTEGMADIVKIEAGGGDRGADREGRAGGDSGVRAHRVAPRST